jgi:hypothetical protein
MKVATVSRMTKAIGILHHAHVLYRAFLKPLCHTQSCAERSTSRQASAYTMLVASDIQCGIRGILP